MAKISERTILTAKAEIEKMFGLRVPDIVLKLCVTQAGHIIDYIEARQIKSMDRFLGDPKSNAKLRYAGEAAAKAAAAFRR